MRYKKGTRRRAREYEPEMVKYWKEHKTFEKSVESRPEKDAYVFYDGPPFLTGTPHFWAYFDLCYQRFYGSLSDHAGASS
jgi:isoleucyl-tRNA synthetase